MARFHHTLASALCDIEPVKGPDVVLGLVAEGVVVGREGDFVFHISSMAGFGPKVKRFEPTVTKLHNRAWAIVHTHYSLSNKKVGYLSDPSIIHSSFSAIRVKFPRAIYSF